MPLTFRRPPEAVWDIGLSGAQRFVVRTYANCDIEADFDGVPMRRSDGGKWQQFEGRAGDSAGLIRVARHSPDTLLLDYVLACTPYRDLAKMMAGVTPADTIIEWDDFAMLGDGTYHLPKHSIHA